MCNLNIMHFSITKINCLSINLNEVRKLWINIKLTIYLMKKKI